MSLRLHIERLVVDETVLGRTRSSALRAAVEEALRHELGRVGASERLAGLGRVDALVPATLASPRHPGDGLAGRLAATVGASLGIGTTAPIARDATKGTPT